MGNHARQGSYGDLLCQDICTAPVYLISDIAWSGCLYTVSFFKAEKTVVHILSDNEVKAAFQMIDNYIPALNTPTFHRMAAECKVIFRLLYCCGLRISEARKLKRNDISLKEGTVRILQSSKRLPIPVAIISNVVFFIDFPLF